MKTHSDMLRLELTQNYSLVLALKVLLHCMTESRRIIEALAAAVVVVASREF